MLLFQIETTTPEPLIIVAWLLTAVIFTFLFVRMVLIYQKEKLRTTIFYAGFFGLMSVGNILGLAITLRNLGEAWSWIPFGEEWTLVLFLFAIFATSVLLLAALETVDLFRFWPAPVLFAVIALLLTLGEIVNPEIATLFGLI
ncbi:MAG: hypothetical protein ACFFBD_03500, partial [Candidatus Hodarchaeota archaeon]